jgi:hypothetical protein
LHRVGFESPSFTLAWAAPDVKQFTPARSGRQYSLCRPNPGFGIQEKSMSTRRMAYWWLRFVISGRFLEKFFNLRRSGRQSRK